MSDMRDMRGGSAGLPLADAPATFGGMAVIPCHCVPVGQTWIVAAGQDGCTWPACDNGNLPDPALPEPREPTELDGFFDL